METYKNNSHGGNTTMLCGIRLAGPPEYKRNRDQVEDKMSEQWEEICVSCRILCQPHDQYTNFGCSSYDPPEPLDPEYICKDCWPEYKTNWVKRFWDGGKYGDWQKSNAEREAAKECGLVWVGSGGHGMLGSKDFADSYQYITQEEYDRLDKLPYYGYCKVCGKENKGGYCSDSKCKESFEKKNGVA